MATHSIIATDSILVVCRPSCYYRDRSTGRTHAGPQGKVGSPKFKEGSPAFRISRTRYERDAGLPDNQRIFQKVGSDDAPTN